MRVLVVDDEPDIAETIGEWLQLRGYEADLVSRSAQALELLAVRRYDLVFLDLSMPEITGLELLDWIKKTAPATKTVIISAYPYPLVEDLLAHAIGIDDYIAKPFSFEQIEKIVKKHCADAEKNAGQGG